MTNASLAAPLRNLLSAIGTDASEPLLTAAAAARLALAAHDSIAAGEPIDFTQIQFPDNESRMAFLTNPDHYTHSQLETALAVTFHLLADYHHGDLCGGEMDWEWLDGTRELGVSGLPEANAAARDWAIRERYSVAAYEREERSDVSYEAWLAEILDEYAEDNGTWAEGHA